ncbi:MAG: cell division protein ZapA [Rhodothermales bacterium]|nr:cell division protein ZapA [Rhodothermales bacterium]MBO6780306.1 cell division protein ZapA [Rhodothermales bacterium]
MGTALRVQILGRDYTLRVREENHELTRQLAEYVDSKMTAFRDSHPEQSDTTAAVITALAIAEELFLERATREEVRDSVDAQLGDLEKALAGALTARP